MGAWIETPFSGDIQRTEIMSHPVWVRGLKPVLRNKNRGGPTASHPVWVRGLKRQNCGRSVPRYTKVAPRVGAWIETTGHGGVRLGDEVAPRVGAWIETIMRLLEEVNTTSRTPCGCVD